MAVEYTPEFVERGYNNRAAVPDHPRWLAHYPVASAKARAALAPKLDLRFGSGPKETLDLFLPPRPAKGTFVFWHGGYWRALDKRDFSFVAPPFTREGAIVVVPNYALAPRVTIETITLQMVQALVWVYRNAALYGGDPERVAVAGHSAGGHLTAMLVSCAWNAVASDLPAGLVSGGLSISGLFDLEPIRQTPFLAADLRLTPASARRLSPASFPPPARPLYATVGGGESAEFLRQNELIRSAWGDNAVPVCEAIPDANHFNVLDDLIDPHGRLHGLALRLLHLTA